MNAHEFYSAFVRTAQESTLVTKEMLPSFPEAWETATFLDLYRNNEPAYTELVNKYIVHKIIKDAGMTPQHEYFRIDTVGWITRYQEMQKAAQDSQLKLSAHLWNLEIAVEHENSRKDWTDEVIKLIHVKCPLKVVISHSRCDERDTTEWKKLNFIARWMQEVKAFTKGSDEEYLLIFGNCFNPKTKADYDTFDYRGYLYPVKGLVAGREDAHIAEMFTDIYTGNGKYIHRNISFSAGDHPLQEPTGAHMTQVSSEAAPYQPKH